MSRVTGAATQHKQASNAARTQETGTSMNKRIRSWCIALSLLLAFALGMAQPAGFMRHALADELDEGLEQAEEPAASEPLATDAPDPEPVDETPAVNPADVEPVLEASTPDPADTGAEDKQGEAEDEEAAQEVASDEALQAQADDGNSDETPTTNETAFWTVAIYMCGSDLEDGGAASNNISDLLKADIPDNVNVIMLTGGAYNWQNNEQEGYVKPNATKTQLWRIRNHKMELLETRDYQDLANKNVLKDFLDLCIDNYPAEHMMVEFWNHGGGPLKGAEFSYVAGATNEDSDGAYMPTNDLQWALENSSAHYGKKFDLIAFDTCLMSNVEVAYAFRNCGNYLLASEEPASASGWNYYWPEIFGESSFTGLSGDAQALALAKRIVDLAPYGKGMELSRDVDLCRSNWPGFPRNMTWAVTDLSKMEPVKNAADALGAELLKVYGTDGSSADYTKLMRATARLRGMDENELGLLDVYKLCRAIIGANINDSLNSAAQKLIDATGTPQDTGGKGHIGEPATAGCMAYIGLWSGNTPGNGITIFFPAAMDTDKVFLASATNDFDGQWEDSTATSYRRLAFAKDAANYEAFMQKLANTTEERKTYGSTIGIELDDASNKVYMTVPEGKDPDRLVSVNANFTANWSDGKEYYLGQRIATYNAELDRYEADADQQWLCRDGVPFTYFQGSINNNIYYNVPCVMVDEEPDVTTGSIVPLSKVSMLKVGKSWFYGVGGNEELYATSTFARPGEDVNKRTEYLKGGGITIRLLRRQVNDDGTYGDYVAGDAITLEECEQTKDNGGFLHEYTLGVTNSAPSDAAVKLTGWNFVAYDKNRNEYASDSYYLVDMNLDKLELMDIADQTYTGSAIRPEALFSLGDVTDLTAETLNAALPGYSYRATYTNNVKIGTATMTVEVISDRTGEVVKTLVKEFKIVAAPEPANESKGSPASKLPKTGDPMVTLLPLVTLGSVLLLLGATFRLGRSRKE